MLTDLLARMDFTGPPPAVGVSACLLGDAVRYDGDDKFDEAVARLDGWLAFNRYCPEVGIGLSVPRPTIEIRDLEGEERVRGVEDPERDFTEALHGYAERIHVDLHGFIFKARSPSCGWQTTPVMDDRGRQTGTSSGLFNQGLRQRRPSLPFCDEAMLADERQCAAFVLRVWCHRQLTLDPHAAAGLRARAKALEPDLARAVRDQVERGAA